MMMKVMFLQVSVKVVLYNVDVTAMCSVPKCKQSRFIDH